MHAAQEFAQRLAHLTLLTKRIMQSTRSGDYHSAFRGAGLEFDQLRDYQDGDDVRFIDWNSSAKMNRLMIKQFIQERDRSVILALDVSSSGIYSSGPQSRLAYGKELAGALALLAHHNKDNVGLLLFTDKIVSWVPPKRGTSHVARVIKIIDDCQQEPHAPTDLAQALTFLISHAKRNAVVFLISDWIQETATYQKLLTVAACKHDLISVRITDACEQELPNVGLLPVQDPETGEIGLIDTGRHKALLAAWLREQHQNHLQRCRRAQIDLIEVHTKHSFIPPLVNFMQQRIKRSAA